MNCNLRGCRRVKVGWTRRMTGFLRKFSHLGAIGRQELSQTGVSKTFVFCCLLFDIKMLSIRWQCAFHFSALHPR